MVALRANISSSIKRLPINAALSADTRFYRIDDELVEIVAPVVAGRHGADPLTCVVRRGVSGTTPASHLSAADLTPYYLALGTTGLGGGGGGGVTVTGSVGGAISDVTDFGVPLVEDQGGGSVRTSHLLISESDPGAIGAGNFWLNPDVSAGLYGDPLPQLLVRNETDDGWYAVTAPIDAQASGSRWIATTNSDTYEFIVDDGTIRVTSSDGARRISIEDSGFQLRSNVGFTMDGLPTSDPGVAGQLYSDGVPSAGVPKAVKISGG